MTNWASPTRWNNILTLLNEKRTDVDKSVINHTFSEWVKQSDINALRNGLIGILSDYGFTGLPDALNCAGYEYDSWKTWEQNWIADRSLNEIEGILDLMQITSCTYIERVYEITYSGYTSFANFDWVDETSIYYITYTGLNGEGWDLYNLLPPPTSAIRDYGEPHGVHQGWWDRDTHSTVKIHSVEDYFNNLELGIFGKVISEEEITNRIAEEEIYTMINGMIGPNYSTDLTYIDRIETILGGDWFKNQLPGINEGTIIFEAPSNTKAPNIFSYYYNVRFTYSYHTCV